MDCPRQTGMLASICSRARQGPTRVWPAASRDHLASTCRHGAAGHPLRNGASLSLYPFLHRLSPAKEFWQLRRICPSKMSPCAGNRSDGRVVELLLVHRDVCERRKGTRARTQALGNSDGTAGGDRERESTSGRRRRRHTGTQYQTDGQTEAGARA